MPYLYCFNAKAGLRAVSRMKPRCNLVILFSQNYLCLILFYKKVSLTLHKSFA